MKDNIMEAMNKLPEWLQKLWDLKPSLAREAEKDYLILNQRNDKLLAAVSSDIEMERFIYKGITIQRLTRDCLWYVIYNNSIIKISKYRNDLTEWIDYITK